MSGSNGIDLNNPNDAMQIYAGAFLDNLGTTTERSHISTGRVARKVVDGTDEGVYHAQTEANRILAKNFGDNDIANQTKIKFYNEVMTATPTAWAQQQIQAIDKDPGHRGDADGDPMHYQRLVAYNVLHGGQNGMGLNLAQAMDSADQAFLQKGSEDQLMTARRQFADVLRGTQDASGLPNLHVHGERTVQQLETDTTAIRKQTNIDFEQYQVLSALGISPSEKATLDAAITAANKKGADLSGKNSDKPINNFMDWLDQKGITQTYTTTDASGKISTHLGFAQNYDGQNSFEAARTTMMTKAQEDFANLGLSSSGDIHDWLHSFASQNNLAVPTLLAATVTDSPQSPQSHNKPKVDGAPATQRPASGEQAIAPTEVTPEQAKSFQGIYDWTAARNEGFLNAQEAMQAHMLGIHSKAQMQELNTWASQNASLFKDKSGTALTSANNGIADIAAAQGITLNNQNGANWLQQTLAQSDQGKQELQKLTLTKPTPATPAAPQDALKTTILDVQASQSYQDWAKDQDQNHHGHFSSTPDANGKPVYGDGIAGVGTLTAAWQELHKQNGTLTTEQKGAYQGLLDMAGVKTETDLTQSHANTLNATLTAYHYTPGTTDEAKLANARLVAGVAQTNSNLPIQHPAASAPQVASTGQPPAVDSELKGNGYYRTQFMGEAAPGTASFVNHDTVGTAHYVEVNNDSTYTYIHTLNNVRQSTIHVDKTGKVMDAQILGADGKTMQDWKPGANSNPTLQTPAAGPPVLAEGSNLNPSARPNSRNFGMLPKIDFGSGENPFLPAGLSNTNGHLPLQANAGYTSDFSHLSSQFKFNMQHSPTTDNQTPLQQFDSMMKESLHFYPLSPNASGAFSFHADTNGSFNLANLDASFAPLSGVTTGSGGTTTKQVDPRKPAAPLSPHS